MGDPVCLRRCAHRKVYKTWEEEVHEEVRRAALKQVPEVQVEEVSKEGWQVPQFTSHEQVPNGTREEVQGLLLRSVRRSDRLSGSQRCPRWHWSIGGTGTPQTERKLCGPEQRGRAARHQLPCQRASVHIYIGR